MKRRAHQLAQRLTGRPQHVEPEAIDLHRQHAAALLPADLLHDDEIIILMLKPSPWYIVLEPLRSLAVIALFTAAAVWVTSLGWLGLDVRDVFIAGIGVAGVRLFWQFLEWLSRIYVLTDRRVIRIKGVLRIQIFESSLKHIQHTQLYFSLRERLLGLGTLAFATAGSGVIEAAWLMVSHPLEVHQTVRRALDRYR